MMRPPVIVIETNGGTPPAHFEPAVKAGTVEVVEQINLDERSFEHRAGVITNMHMDQILFAELQPALERFFSAGGRMAFMGHIVKTFLPELMPFEPLSAPKRASFVLTELADHPIFDGTPREAVETRKGVAGFYGRGHVPPPSGAVPLTGLGPEHLPVDWVWARPGGGELFVHAGNNLWTVADDASINQGFVDRMIEWCAAGALQSVE